MGITSMIPIGTLIPNCLSKYRRNMMGKMIRSIYLAGAIEQLPDGGLEWREMLKAELAELGIRGIIPQDLNAEQELPPEEWNELRATDPDNYRKVFFEKVIKPDIIHGVLTSSALIINWSNTPTSGTHGEATFARMNKIPVIILLAPGTLEESIPAWLFGCSTAVFDNKQTLLAFLEGWNSCASE